MSDRVELEFFIYGKRIVFHNRSNGELIIDTTNPAFVVAEFERLLLQKLNEPPQRTYLVARTAEKLGIGKI